MALTAKRRKTLVGRLGTILLAFLVILLLAIAIFTGILFWQAQQRPVGKPQYVALGSSFAAGIGLGNRIADSPLVCQRTVNSYPQHIARSTGLSLVDMSCSAATTTQVLRGGQVFLGPQLDGLGPDTQLVTITSGGNDVRYVGDLTFMAGSKSDALLGRLMRLLGTAAKAPDQRPYAQLQRDLIATFREIHVRSPHARIVAVTYPLILPPRNTCAKLALTEAEVTAMRAVGERLAEVTRKAARQGGVTLVDMQRLGVGHDVCSQNPWVNGWVGAAGTPFHPNLQGANAMARAVVQALGEKA